MTTKTKVCILGAGAWGTALAIHLAKKKLTVHLWAHHEEHAKLLRSFHQNTTYLPDVNLPKNILITADIKQALTEVDAICIVVPSSYFVEVIHLAKPYIRKDTHILWATKGLVAETGALLQETIFTQLGHDRKVAVLSGPSFAKEVAIHLPTAVTIASNDAATNQYFCELFQTEYFRPYASDDLIGVQIGGAVKNVLAIAVGMADGLHLGANARAALITRGLAEMQRFALALGAKAETIYGLSGVGDLILTCTDDQSRNRRFGLLLAQGHSVKSAQQRIGQSIEGLKNCHLIFKRAQELKVEMPIVNQIVQIVTEKTTPQEAAKNLLLRELKEE